MIYSWDCFGVSLLITARNHELYPPRGREAIFIVAVATVQIVAVILVSKFSSLPVIPPVLFHIRSALYLFADPAFLIFISQLRLTEFLPWKTTIALDALCVSWRKTKSSFVRDDVKWKEGIHFVIIEIPVDSAAIKISIPFRRNS